MISDLLRTACDEAVQDEKLAPQDGKTFCNLGVQVIAERIGYGEFLGMLANQIVDHLERSGDFEDVGPLLATKKANSGVLVIAALRGKPHGHVAVVYPSGVTYSGKWKKECPVVANVGKRNGIMGANYAFDSEPSYHARMA